MRRVRTGITLVILCLVTIPVRAQNAAYAECFLNYGTYVCPVPGAIDEVQRYQAELPFAHHQKAQAELHRLAEAGAWRQDRQVVTPLQAQRAARQREAEEAEANAKAQGYDTRDIEAAHGNCNGGCDKEGFERQLKRHMDARIEEEQRNARLQAERQVAREKRAQDEATRRAEQDRAKLEAAQAFAARAENEKRKREIAQRLKGEIAHPLLQAIEDQVARENAMRVDELPDTSSLQSYQLKFAVMSAFPMCLLALANDVKAKYGADDKTQLSKGFLTYFPKRCGDIAHKYILQFGAEKTETDLTLFIIDFVANPDQFSQ
jgi:hypothetical protein